ncbi:hypothetical protein BDV3_005277 [Batrachochytrium dendrobatidis]
MNICELIDEQPVRTLLSLSHPTEPTFFCATTNTTSAVKMPAADLAAFVDAPPPLTTGKSNPQYPNYSHSQYMPVAPSPISSCQSNPRQHQIPLTNKNSLSYQPHTARYTLAHPYHRYSANSNVLPSLLYPSPALTGTSPLQSPSIHTFLSTPSLSYACSQPMSPFTLSNASQPFRRPHLPYLVLPPSRTLPQPDLLQECQTTIRSATSFGQNFNETSAVIATPMNALPLFQANGAITSVSGVISSYTKAMAAPCPASPLPPTYSPPIVRVQSPSIFKNFQEGSSRQKNSFEPHHHDCLEQFNQQQSSKAECIKSRPVSQYVSTNQCTTNYTCSGIRFNGMRINSNFEANTSDLPQTPTADTCDATPTTIGTYIQGAGNQDIAEEKSHSAYSLCSKDVAAVALTHSDTSAGTCHTGSDLIDCCSTNAVLDTIRTTTTIQDLSLCCTALSTLAAIAVSDESDSIRSTLSSSSIVPSTITLPAPILTSLDFPSQHELISSQSSSTVSSSVHSIPMSQSSPFSNSSVAALSDNGSSYTPSYSSSPSHSILSTSITAKQISTHSSLRQQPQKSKTKHVFLCTFPGCSLGFTRRQNLRSHMTIHTNERPHACDKCPATFRRRQELLRHCRSVHAPAGVKLFRCSHCLRLFGRADALKRHIIANGGTFGEDGVAPWACSRSKSSVTSP